MLDYRYADKSALQFLFLIPVLLGLSWYMVRRSGAVLRARVAPRLLTFLTRSVSTTRRRVRLGLRLAALFFFVIALARPQLGEGRQKVKNEALEMMLMVDVSNSMLAEDARPSRLELAKRELTRLVESLGGDKIGIVAFAGSAILVSPMTSDKGALKMYIDSLSTETVSTQGTDFKRGLKEAYGALQRGGIEGDENRGVTRVIIIASDGEENEKGGLDTARQIAGEGARIFTLGFGTAQGAQIPQRDRDGRLIGYKRERGGQVIVSKSTGEALKALAEAGKGVHRQVTFGDDAIAKLKADIDTLQRVQIESMDITNYEELYAPYLLIGISLALVELALGERRREGLRWRGRFEVARE